jgi:peptidoglycan/LPS O-acetylase OafA/YrhL
MSVAVDASPGEIPSAAATKKSRFRPDIEGLRAVSVLLVIAGHAGVPFLAGGFIGVDVFFVISGFLITGLLYRESTSTGRISLRDFYARRVRRILPMAAVVLVSICLASWLLMPSIDRGPVATDVSGAALFVSNWVFALQANDYFAMDVASSPVLHFWSLSVEEQFYVFWPLLMIVVALISRRRAVVLAVLAIPVVASLVISIVSSANSIISYYGLQTRLWELGAGGLAAILLAGRTVQVPTPLRPWLGYGGLALIALGAVSFSETTTFPGVNALLPVCGALLVIITGSPDTPSAGILAWRPMQYIGARSYNLYLWHWPLLVFVALYVADDITAAVVGVTATAVITIVTFRFIETPARKWSWLAARPRRALWSGLAMIVVTVCAAQLLASTGTDEESVATVELPQTPVAKTLPGYGKSVWPLRNATQKPEVARKDRYIPPKQCEPKDNDPLGSECVFGDPTGTTRIALVGDSHAGAWLPAFDSLGKKNGIQISYWGHAGWTAAPVVRADKQRDDALAWSPRLAAMIATQGPFDAVFIARTSGQYGVGALSPEGALLEGDAAAPAFESATRTFVSQISSATSKVVFMRGTYWANFNATTCLSENAGSGAACTFTRTRADDALAAAELRGAEQAYPSHIFEVDPASLACPTGMTKCPTVAPDGTIIMRDASHLTTTFSRNVSGQLYTLLRPYIS